MLEAFNTQISDFQPGLLIEVVVSFPELSRPGVYVLGSDVGLYVGSSTNIRNRLKGHLYGLRSGKHDNDRLLEAYKRGEMFVVFVKHCDVEQLEANEQIFIDALHPRLNRSRIAANPALDPDVQRKISISRMGQPSPMRGMRHSAEAKRKLSEAHLGLKRSIAARSKTASACRAKWHEADYRAKMMSRKPGHSRPHTMEGKAAISAAKRGRKWTNAERMARTRAIGNAMADGRMWGREGGLALMSSLNAAERRARAKSASSARWQELRTYALSALP